VACEGRRDAVLVGFLQSREEKDVEGPWVQPRYDPAEQLANTVAAKMRRDEAYSNFLRRVLLLLLLLAPRCRRGEEGSVEVGVGRSVAVVKHFQQRAVVVALVDKVKGGRQGELVDSIEGEGPWMAGGGVRAGVEVVNARREPGAGAAQVFVIFKHTRSEQGCAEEERGVVGPVLQCLGHGRFGCAVKPGVGSECYEGSKAFV
jgi:hypothetical protein